MAELRPHLRSCPACRATLREFHAAPAPVAALVPVALLPLASPAGGALTGHVAMALHGLVERLTLLAARVQAGVESVPATKLAAIAASTAALAGGGAAIEQVAHSGVGSHGVPAAAAAAAVVDPALGSLALSPASDLLSATARHGRRTASHGEFARPSTAPSEFRTRVPGAAEFATTSAASPLRAQVASAPAAPPPAVSRPPSEFGGP